LNVTLKKQVTRQSRVSLSPNEFAGHLETQLDVVLSP